jgi:hypothetical protein
MIHPMFSSKQFRKRQRRHSIAATACWLLLMLLNCSAVAGPAAVAAADSGHGHHMEMADSADMGCCQSPAPDCCEPASQVVPSKHTDVDDNLLPLTAAILARVMLISDFQAPAAAYDHGLEFQYPPYRLHLLHCRFLV